MSPASFACPPDCGWCCTHLSRALPREEARAQREFRAALRELGVYHCGDAMTRGLSLSGQEADAMRAAAKERGVRLPLHPRTYLLETRRRLAVVLDWHMPREACPLYQDFRCGAYHARPLVCRAFPVLSPAPRWGLAPECPRAEPTLADARAGSVRLGSFLRVEARARREVEARHALLDDAAMRLLDAPGARFAKGLAPAEAARRARAYRKVAPEALGAP